MEIAIHLIWLLPAALLISTIAMATGVGGAIFYSPLFIIVLGLEPKVAIGTALITELFGFSSGLFSYSRLKLIDYKLGMRILSFSIPFALLGLYIGKYLPPDVLKGIFATGIIFIAYQIFTEWLMEESLGEYTKHHKGASDTNTVHVDASGKQYHYAICNRHIGNFLSAIGGLFVGMISVGLGELLDYHLVSKCKVPTPIAVGTAIFAVVITVLIASLGHFYEFFFHSTGDVLNDVLEVVIFTIPGVLIGGQLGPKLQEVLPESYVKVGLSVLFVIVGLLMFFTIIR